MPKSRILSNSNNSKYITNLNSKGVFSQKVNTAFTPIKGNISAFVKSSKSDTPLKNLQTSKNIEQNLVSPHNN